MPDGFGIGYLIKNDGVQFCVSSFRRQTMRFLELLSMSLNDLRQMLAADKPKVRGVSRAVSLLLRALHWTGLDWTGLDCVHLMGARTRRTRAPWCVLVGAVSAC